MRVMLLWNINESLLCNFCNENPIFNIFGGSHMQDDNPLELEQLLIGKPARRRKLIPVWIKIFIWIFIVFTCFIPPTLLMSLMGYHPLLALYGLETTDTFYITWWVICSLFLFKGITGFALWSEKSYAIKLGIVDAVIGILICCTVMFAPVFNGRLVSNYRLELVALIPYLIWLLKVKEQWEER
jgi:hypothetical protein